jgi:hypothetical protein
MLKVAEYLAQVVLHPTKRTNVQRVVRFAHRLLLDCSMVKVDVAVHDIYWVLLIRLNDFASIVHIGKLDVSKPTAGPFWCGAYNTCLVSTS